MTAHSPTTDIAAVIAGKRAGLADLCQRYRVRRLELFGSAATGADFDPSRSDLDFLVAFEPGQKMGPWLKHYFDLRAELESLFGRPVDLVMASAVKKPAFEREVNRTRRVVYAA